MAIDVSRASGNRAREMRNQKIGFVFQSFNLLPKFNVLQNVELPMIYSGVSAQRTPRPRAGSDRAGRTATSREEHAAPAQRRPDAARGHRARPGQSTRKSFLPMSRPATSTPKPGANILELFRELSEQGSTIVLVTHDNKIAAQTPRRIEIARRLDRRRS